MQTISLCMLKNCLYILMFHNTTKEWHAPRIVWTPAQVQTILGTFHHLVIIFSENKGFYVALPTMVQITWFFLHYVLSVTRSLICFRSLKSPISALNIDTGFLGFFSADQIWTLKAKVNSIHPIKIWQLTVTLMWQPFQSPETIAFDNREASVSFHNCTIKK